MNMRQIRRVAQEWLGQTRAKEYFLVLFKPLAVRGNLAEDLRGQLSKLNVVEEETRRVKVDRNIMAQMYDEYKHEPFFNKLVDYYDDKPVEVSRYVGPQGSTLALQRRLGPYNPTMCIPGEDFNSDAMSSALTNSDGGVRDLIHTSDCPLSGVRELALWRLTPPEGIELEIPERGVPLPTTPGMLERATMIWGKWAKQDPNDPTAQNDILASGIGATLFALLRSGGITLSDFNVEPTTEGARVIWFLPYSAWVNPVYIMPGQEAVYAARSGGVRGANLGWEDPPQIVERLTKLSNLT